LTTEKVIDAAIEIGIDGLTMAAVAKKLGVRITVLYGYVRGREDLLRLAVARTSQHFDLPADTGQLWPMYVASHAVALFSLLTGPGQLMSQFASGGLGPEVEIDRAELWLEALTSRGFTAAAALLLQRQMGEIVLGGAMTALQTRSVDASGKSFEVGARQAISARGDADISVLKTVENEFASREPIWPLTLVRLLESIAEERDEHFDRDAVTEILGRAAID
jgi:AcrR family transcriptional regulator